MCCQGGGGGRVGGGKGLGGVQEGGGRHLGLLSAQHRKLTEAPLGWQKCKQCMIPSKAQALIALSLLQHKGKLHKAWQQPAHLRLQPTYNLQLMQ